MINYDIEYDAIKAHYKNKQSKRLGQPYMLHIDDGIKILRRIGADDATVAAWCLHPIVQVDESLADWVAGRLDDVPSIDECGSLAVLLATEYRAVANAGRMAPWRQSGTLPSILLPEVKQMLIADKVQNFYALISNGSALRSQPDPHGVMDNYFSAMVSYFEAWMIHLGVSHEQFLQLVGLFSPDDYGLLPNDVFSDMK